MCDQKLRNTLLPALRDFRLELHFLPHECQIRSSVMGLSSRIISSTLPKAWTQWTWNIQNDKLDNNNFIWDNDDFSRSLHMVTMDTQQSYNMPTILTREVDNMTKHLIWGRGREKDRDQLICLVRIKLKYQNENNQFGAFINFLHRCLLSHSLSKVAIDKSAIISYVYKIHDIHTVNGW